MMLETTSAAPWAKNGLAAEAEALRKKALRARQQGQKMAMIKPAADLVANAYERAARVLIDEMNAINQGVRP